MYFLFLPLPLREVTDRPLLNAPVIGSLQVDLFLNILDLVFLAGGDDRGRLYGGQRVTGEEPWKTRG